MSKLLVSVLAAGGIAAVASIPALPASAQSAGAPIAEIVVFGDDPCPRSTDSEVVVCARKPEAERYRIPEVLRSPGPRQTRESWAHRAKSFEYVGRTGTMSCSAVGPGGHTGCLQNMIERAEAEWDDQVQEGTPPPEQSVPGDL